MFSRGRLVLFVLTSKGAGNYLIGTNSSNGSNAAATGFRRPSGVTGRVLASVSGICRASLDFSLISHVTRSPVCPAI